MEEKTLVFTLERETKNTIRYQEKPEAGQPAIVGTLYVQKFVFPGDVPQELTVTIKSQEAL